MRENRPNVFIVIAKCRHEKGTYGIRFEERTRGLWYGTWAFPIKESTAHKEHYDKNRITGSIHFDQAYPGCPFCRSTNVFQCGKCHNISCWDNTKRVICPWCNTSITIDGFIEQIDASGDR